MSTPLHPEWLEWPQTKQLLAAFDAHAGALRFVGGGVRDALLNRAVSDVDAATSLLPEQVLELLENAGIRAIPTGLAHGTVTAVIAKKQFEITTLRRDTVCDGRHATVEYTDDWQQDAQRRDFTMNALYLTPEGELFDYFEGASDAELGHVRFIGEASARVAEDYLRILRFFRFYASYGTNDPDPQALAACAASASQLSSISGERIQQEMLKLLTAPAPYAALSAMQETVVLSALGLAFAQTIQGLKQVESQSGIQVDALTRLSALLPDSPNAAQGLAERWKLSNQALHRLQDLAALRGQLYGGLIESEQKKLLRRLGAPLFKEVVLLAWANEPKSEGYLPMFTLADSWDIPAFPVTGKDLQALGIPEGKALGERLRALEEIWEQSGYALTREQLLDKVKAEN